MTVSDLLEQPCNESDCNLNGRENDERTQVDTNTNKITPGLNGA